MRLLSFLIICVSAYSFLIVTPMLSLTKSTKAIIKQCRSNLLLQPHQPDTAITSMSTDGDGSTEIIRRQFPATVDPRSIGIVLTGQGIILLLALGIGKMLNIDAFHLQSLVISRQSFLFGLATGSALAAAGAAIDRLPLEWSQKLIRDTKIYSLMLLGRETSSVKAIAITLLLSLAAGVTEELLFRGVLLPLISGFTGTIPALLISSAMFGLAHVASFGPGSVIESILGFSFGATFLYAKGNILVPILVHTVYDLWTLLCTWLNAKEEMSIFIKKKKFYEQYRETVLSKAAEASDRETYVNDVIRAIFNMIDTNKDNKIDLDEVYQALKLLGLDWNPFPAVKNSSLSLSSRAKVFVESMDTDKDGLISFSEFKEVMQKAYEIKPPISVE